MQEIINKSDAPTKTCGEACKISSRRQFLKNGLFAVGAAAVGFGSLGGFANTPARGTVTNVYRPRYLDLAANGELERRERAFWAKMENCSLCPRMCGTNRMRNRQGICSTGRDFRVASHGPHFGEERPLVGRNGSGTIFFSNCNLLCIFCQNWQIAHRGEGRVTTHAELAAMMISLQRRGAHNINFVTPTHIVPHIVSSLRMAIDQGLNIPILYNSSGYETMEVMELLDGIVDVYLPDFKYQDSRIAARFSQGAHDYTEYAAAAIKEMHRQVGTLDIQNGIANRGLLIRHLVMPENLAGTDVFARWVVDELGADTHVNIMGQFRPEFRAREFPPLDRRTSPREFEQAMRWAREAGLRNFH